MSKIETKQTHCKACDKVIESTGPRAKEYCNDACRKAYNRTKSVIESGQIQTGQVKADKASLEHYQSNPSMYSTRANAELLNWGDPMSMVELGSKGLKANRVPIPGDHDYTGKAQFVGDRWYF